MDLTNKLGPFCLVVVAAIALIAQAQPAHADKVKPADDVNVVNTPTVNIGTPTVQANQTGPWTVGLSGPVTVAPPQLLQVSCDSSLIFQDNINECVITAPAGKRFVVQNRRPEPAVHRNVSVRLRRRQPADAGCAPVRGRRVESRDRAALQHLNAQKQPACLGHRLPREHVGGS